MLCAILIVNIGGCGCVVPFFRSDLNFKTPEEQTVEYSDNLMKILTEKDEVAFKELLCQDILDNDEHIDDEIHQAFNFIEGDILSYDGAERNSEAGFRDEDHYLVYSENLYEEISKSTTDRFINLVEVDVEGNRYGIGGFTITDAGIEIGTTKLDEEVLRENATSFSPVSNVRIVNKN